MLWGPDLIALDVMVPKGHPLHSDDVVEAYRWVGETLASALGSLDMSVRALPPDEARRANDPHLAELACYAGRSPWEVVLGERKVVGLSQVRRRQGTLVQAGFALHLDGPGLAGLLRLEPDDRHRVAGAFGRQRPPMLIDLPSLVQTVDAAVERVLAEADPQSRDGRP